MHITIKGEFASLNEYINAERGNRYKAASIKKSAESDIMWQLKQYHCETLTGQYRVHFTWYTKDERTDADNTSFAQKFLMDSLVKSGILKNDSRKHIVSLYHDFEVDKGNPRVEIDLLEIEKREVKDAFY
jgi:Holliday junction resolvase RusA-like endonuclease